MLTPFITSFSSYLLMLAAYRLPRHRYFHIPVMISCILFDIAMPIYLYTHRHWWHRLVEQGDIFSFLVWMHFGLLITMYVLYGAQISTALKIFKGDPEARVTHHAQGKALLLARALVIITGAILANPVS
jgi:hypothetical protein